MLPKRIIGLQPPPGRVDQSHVMHVVNIDRHDQILISQRLLRRRGGSRGGTRYLSRCSIVGWASPWAELMGQRPWRP